MGHIIGRVYRDSFEKGGKEYQTLVLDIRTISVRKKFTIAVNKHKYKDGDVNAVPEAGREHEPDYHIWHNFSARGESIPSVIVGGIRNMTGQGGAYKRATLFDPFLSPYETGFFLFEAKEGGDVLYNVVAEPFGSERQRREVPVVTETIPKES
jgi:hypothetical protein